MGRKRLGFISGDATVDNNMSKEINRVEWGMYYKKIFKLYDVFVREIYRLTGKVKPMYMYM